jgi:nucleoside-diphosphate-sugar epimerase
MNLKDCKILLTGATGLIGGEIYYRLSIKSNVYLLCRNAKTAKERLLNRQKAIIGNKPTNDFNIVEGDITKSNWGLNKFDYDMVIHCAGETSFIKKKNCYDVNVTGIKHLIKLIKNTNTKLIYFGTASSCGIIKNTIIDENTNPSDEFYNAYTETKHKSETLIKENLDNYLILRPTIVLGDNVIDEKFALGIGWAIYVTRYFNELPFNPDSNMDYLQVSYVGKATIKLLEKEKLNHKEYLISCGKDNIKVREIMDFLQKYFSLKKEIAIGEDLKYNYDGEQRKLFRILKHYVPFINMNVVYDNSRLINEFDELKEVAPLFDYLGLVLNQIKENNIYKGISSI